MSEHTESINQLASEGILSTPERTYLQDVALRLRRHRLSLISVTYFASLLVWTLIGPTLSPYLYSKVNIRDRLQPPSASHVFGTDELGRDVVVRTMMGGRVSLVIGISAAVLSTVAGISVGVISGYFGGPVDMFLMRITDIMLSIPSLPLLLILSRVAGGSLVSIVLIVTIFSWMGLARIVRGTVLSLKERDYVDAARLVGVKTSRILVRHLLPNTMAPVIVSGTLSLGYAILTESSLSYLGLGVQPPTPSWGNILMNAQQYMDKAPWLSLIPGLFIFFTLLSVNFLGDGLRDALDPRLKV